MTGAESDLTPNPRSWFVCEQRGNRCWKQSSGKITFLPQSSPTQDPSTSPHPTSDSRKCTCSYIHTSYFHPTPEKKHHWKNMGWQKETHIRYQDTRVLAWLLVDLDLGNGLLRALIAISTIKDDHFVLLHGSTAGVSVVWRLDWAGAARMLTHFQHAHSH